MSNYDNQEIQEFFSVPINLKEVDNLYGFKVYSSDGLVKAFLKSIEKSSKGNFIYKPIEKLVQQKKIMPIYQIKGVLSFLKHKMFGHPSDKAIMGFYHLGVKRVYVMIDNNVSILGHAKNDEIASTTVHECQHLFADLNRGKFVSIFKDELRRYYSSAFSRIFKLNQIPKNINKIVTTISSFEGVSLNKVLNKWPQYKKVLESMKPYSDLSDEEFDKKVDDIRIIITLFTRHFDLFVRNYRHYPDIFKGLNRAYRDAFNKQNTHTSPYQELINTSEVICVFSEMRPGNSKIKKVFREFS
jgi:hypothetical protein